MTIDTSVVGKITSGVDYNIEKIFRGMETCAKLSNFEWALTQTVHLKKTIQELAELPSEMLSSSFDVTRLTHACDSLNEYFDSLVKGETPRLTKNDMKVFTWYIDHVFKDTKHRR
ncbi:hypothetical protein ACP6H1_27495 [Vibrio harveyi]|uniref:hypothetical protein n=1 Tax=Vibrio harveyi TaxID=669 RepID=UPI003CE6AD26